MSTKTLKRLAVLALCAITLLCSVITVGAVSEYTISELDDMVLSLPDDMSAITRSTPSTDKYFSNFGSDYTTTIQSMTNSDMYMEARDSMSSLKLTVTMTKTSESESIGNYTKLSQEELTQIRNNFLNMKEFISCTPDQSDNLVWFIFNTTVSNNEGTINTYQANTVYDGMNINITLQRTDGNVTNIDYNIFSQTISSVHFLKGGFTTDILPYFIIGGSVIIVLLVVLIIILASRIRKRKKIQRNDAILGELASKYNLKDKKESSGSIDNSIEKTSGEKSKAVQNHYSNEESVSSEQISSGYSSDDEIDDIINSAKAYKQSLSDDDEKYNYVPKRAEAEKKKETTEADISENDTEAYEEYEEINQYEEINPQQQPSSVSTEEAVPDNFDINENYEKESKYVNALFGTDTSTDDEDQNDKELVRQEAKSTRFDNSNDFFEEAPRKVMGVLNSKDIANAEDYDVIGEEEEKADKVKAQDESKQSSVSETLVKAGNGVKSFFTHLGYFCKNVSIMIKRKRMAAKRRKAELERRERERQRAERAKQRAKMRAENGGLVKVHSRSDTVNSRVRRPSNVRTSSQSRNNRKR